MRRAGGSLSLSENEMESEVEFDIKPIRKSDASLSLKWKEYLILHYKSNNNLGKSNLFG